MEAQESQYETIGEEREEVRPGLVMIRRRIRKADGRRLTFFDFERPAAPADASRREGSP